MINPIKVQGNALMAFFRVDVAGMTLQVSAGYYANGLGSVAWDAHDIDMTTPNVEHRFCVWVLADGTLAAAQGPDEPTPPANMRDRLVWGVIPAGCTDLAQAAVNVLTIVPEGGE